MCAWSLVDMYQTVEMASATILIRAAGVRQAIMTLPVPVDPGDVLDVSACARITNDASMPRYNVVIGARLFSYDADTPGAEWVPIGSSTAENVTPAGHHMQLATFTVHQVPDDWPTGHPLTVILSGAAASTAVRDGDSITVDKDFGRLVVRRWVKPLTDPTN